MLIRGLTLYMVITCARSTNVSAPTPLRQEQTTHNKDLRLPRRFIKLLLPQRIPLLLPSQSNQPPIPATSTATTHSKIIRPTGNSRIPHQRKLLFLPMLDRTQVK